MRLPGIIADASASRNVQACLHSGLVQQRRNMSYGHHTQIAPISVATLIAKVAAMPGARTIGPSR
jgi:hypothetical protein